MNHQERGVQSRIEHQNQVTDKNTNEYSGILNALRANPSTSKEYLTAYVKLHTDVCGRLTTFVKNQCHKFQLPLGAERDIIQDTLIKYIEKGFPVIEVEQTNDTDYISKAVIKYHLTIAKNIISDILRLNKKKKKYIQTITSMFSESNQTDSYSVQEQLDNRVADEEIQFRNIQSINAVWNELNEREKEVILKLVLVDDETKHLNQVILSEKFYVKKETLRQIIKRAKARLKTLAAKVP